MPRSLFTADGCLLLPYDKASIRHRLENLLNNSKEGEGEEKWERKEGEGEEDASKGMIPADPMTSSDES